MPGAFVEVSERLLLAFVALSLVLVIGLVVARVAREAIERRRTAYRHDVRALLFDALMGDRDVAETARVALVGRTGRRWYAVEDQAFLMLPKIKGESHTALVGLLMDKGAQARAIGLCHSFSALRRCRGAYFLGALAQREYVNELVALLDDRHFLVRRIAVRALGNLRSASAVGPLIGVIGDEPRLSRDLIYALDRIGPAGVFALRGELQRGLDDPDGPGHHPDLAATVLGHIGDVGSVLQLGAALESGREHLAVAAAEALGLIGSPESIPYLVHGLLSDDPQVRSAAARGLGVVGSPLATDSLIEVVDERDPAVSREAATSLVRLGQPGLDVLATSDSPYAREALALARLRVTT